MAFFSKKMICLTFVALICLSAQLFAGFADKPAVLVQPAQKANSARHLQKSRTGQKSEKELPVQIQTEVMMPPSIITQTKQQNKQLCADVFTSGTEGYHTFRIPAIAVTKAGTVLAFSEGRKNGRSDSGDIDIVLKRSQDGGSTWSDIQVVFDDRENTAGNPCLVVDQHTGTIWLLCTWNHGLDKEAEISTSAARDTRRVFVLHSKDDGVTWSQPLEITASAKLPEWTWYATGPGNGIQLRLGNNKGRMIIPCDHKVKAGSLKYHSHVIYSDDHGLTWQIGGSAEDGTNECHVIERTDGSIMLNMRRSRKISDPYRLIAISDDGGMKWSDYSPDNNLPDPRCQSSFIRYTPSNATGKPIVLHCNPASKDRRIGMTVRASCDDAVTWTYSKVLHKGPSAYSSMAVLPDGKIAALLETGKSHPYEKVVFCCFSLEWLTDGKEKCVRPLTIATKYSLLTEGLVDKAVDSEMFLPAEKTETAAAIPAGFEPNSPDSTAVITTNSFTVDGEMLCVNADIKEGGSLKVVIADEQGNTLSSSRAVKESARQCVITWAEGWQFASIKGKKVRLKFVFEKARLYEFYIK